ncbi:MAG: cytochrome ubiquinol oxidase subunit I [Proteobacteria bacterium]|nr:cytochrome ubiquinol oxidase subunit I [Pseudomonadota bacterium]
MDSVDLSRLQFGVTALYHFLFVPLTLGLSFILAIMESVYVMTKNPIWKDMTKYWGILFGINFAMGVATGVPLEFQFGTNWSYYSHYVGDVFGSLLAIEGLMAFFLEATFIGLFYFGWDRLTPIKHLMCTWLLALGTNFSALWILVANAWMQNPIGSAFNIETMRMEMTSFYDVFFNPVAQSKFVHTVSAGYVAGSMFVLSISAYFLLKNRHIGFAKRSMTVAASFGLASALSVVVLGDESGYVLTENQRMKIAAIEAMWETEPAPAALTLFGIPNEETKIINYKVAIPWLLGIITTRSFNQPVYGINDLVKHSEENIKEGIKAYSALEILRKNKNDTVAKKLFDEHGKHLGYALLLKKIRPDIQNATEQEIKDTAKITVPKIKPLFFSFRIMVGLGIYFILLFGVAFYISARHRIGENKTFLKFAKYSLPLPWVAIELGWYIAETGRQPWTIDGILPTFLSASDISATSVWISLTMFVVFYTILLIVDLFLMRKYIKLGPTLS